MCTANQPSCIAISGLGGHAFGSFKERGGSYMWLRDSLPQDLPHTRILLYGYDSEMIQSQAVQTIRDLANTFRSAIKSIRSYDAVRRHQGIKRVLFSDAARYRGPASQAPNDRSFFSGIASVGL